MKTKINLIIFIGLFSFSSISAQVLTNSTWKVFTTSSAFFFYFNFDGDTISFSNDNISYSNVSIYDEVGSNFDITDLAGFCSIYTGHYTFTISADTLKFTVIEDTCDLSRQTVFNTYYWKAEIVGLQEFLEPNRNNAFPNPATNYFNIVTEINSEIKICDITGKIISTFVSQTENTQIDISNWKAGVYSVIVNNRSAKRLVVAR